MIRLQVLAALQQWQYISSRSEGLVWQECRNIIAPWPGTGSRCVGSTVGACSAHTQSMTCSTEWQMQGSSVAAGQSNGPSYALFGAAERRDQCNVHTLRLRCILATPHACIVPCNATITPFDVVECSTSHQSPDWCKVTCADCGLQYQIVQQRESRPLETHLSPMSELPACRTGTDFNTVQYRA
jgi:hypothetical protein